MQESIVKRRLIKALKNMKPVPFFYMTGAGSYQVSGLPDFIGCHNGHFFAVEAKTTGERPRPDQEVVLDTINNKRGISAVVDSQETIDQFIKTLELLNPL